MKHLNFKNFFSRFRNKHFILFIFFYILTAFFWRYPGANGIPRIATTMSLYNSGDLVIDTYADFTPDKTKIDGKYYSDKAPLSSFLFLPLYAIAHQVAPVFNVPQGKDRVSVAYQGAYAHHAALLMLLQPLFALYCIFLFLTLRKKNLSITLSLLLTTAFSFGTFIFPMTSSYFAHQIAGSFLLVSYFYYIKNDQNAKRLILAGLFCGLAVLSEYLVGIFAIAVAFHICLLHRLNIKKIIHNGFLFSLGMLPCLLIVLWHNYSVTQDPFSMPYSHVTYTEFAPMTKNLGFRAPSLSAIWELLFGQYRGLFFYAPAMLVAFPIWIYHSMQKPQRDNFTVILLPVWIVILSMYYMWDGGFSYGPRHLIPLVMILFYESMIAISGSKRAITTCIILGGLGLFFSLSAQIINPLPPQKFTQPMFEYILPAFFNNTVPIGGNNLAANHFNLNGAVLALALWLGIYSIGFLFLRFIVYKQKKI